MNYKKLIEDYKVSQELCRNCEKSQEEHYKNLTQNIKESLQGKSPEEYSEYFSELFDIWLVITETATDINIDLFNDHKLDKINKKQKPLEGLSNTNEEDNRKDRVRKLLDLSSVSEIHTLHPTKKIIENTLNELWSNIYKNQLTLFNFDNVKKGDIDINQYFHRNWPLYELINQISKPINQIIKKGEIQKIKFSDFDDEKKIDIVANTEEVCNYLLKSYILNSQENKNMKWFPQLKTYKEIQLPYIITTSNLVSYIFKYKLKSTTEKNEHLSYVKVIVENIYDNILPKNGLYDGIEEHMNQNYEEDIVIKYNNHLLSPRTILIFVISIIQDVVKLSLTKNRKNIFRIIKKRGYRDGGLSEQRIIDMIKKDVEIYELIYYYFKKPGRETIKNNKRELNTWIKELNKLRIGVLDDYLFELAETTPISFEETVVRTIKTSKKMA